MSYLDTHGSLKGEVLIKLEARSIFLKLAGMGPKAQEREIKEGYGKPMKEASSLQGYLK